MSYRLSILDKTPLETGGTPLQALQTTLAYAQWAERLGYYRFWVAEHHGSADLASLAPEILAAHLLARTQRLRIGTGGVLLQHYSPYKVAEQFALMAALAPGRVDLGVGKAPGGLPASTRALQAELAAERIPFADKVQALDGFLRDALPADHALVEARLSLRPEVLPQPFILGASPSTASLAGSLGWGYVHAGHHDGSADAIERALTAHSSAAAHLEQAPPAIVSITVFAAGSAAEAQRVAAHQVFKAEFADGQSVKVGSLEAVREHERQRGQQAVSVQEQHPQVIAGTGAQVHEQLQALATRHGVQEFILDCPVAEPAARFRSLELIAAAALRAAA